MIGDPVILKMVNVNAIKTFLGFFVNLQNAKVIVMEEELVIRKKEYVLV
jgi:uncharacterized protein YrrD